MADEQLIPDEEGVPVYRSPWEGFSPDIPYEEIEPLIKESGIEVKETENKIPISTDAYKQEVSDLLDPDSFWELPYREKVKKVRQVFLGEDLSGNKSFEDEQEVTDYHKQILADIREYDGKKFNLPEILAQVPEPPAELKDAIRNKDFDAIDEKLDEWEATTLATLRSGGLRWKEIEDVAEPQLADYVDKTKNELKALKTYGDDPNKLEWFASNISQILRSGGETLASLVPGKTGKELQRKARTATETVPIPFVGSLPMLPPASGTGETAPSLRINDEIEINSEALASGLGSGAAFMGVGAVGAGVGGTLGAFAALVPAAARMGYAEGYDKIYRETGDRRKAIEGAVKYALVESADALISAGTVSGAFRPLTKAISESTKIKAISEAIERGLFGKGLATGFKEVTEAVPVILTEAGTEYAQEKAEGDIIAAYTGEEKYKATPSQLTTAALAGGIIGVAGAGANVSTDIIEEGKKEAADIKSEIPPQQPSQPITSPIGGIRQEVSVATPSPVPESDVKQKVVIEPIKEMQSSSRGDIETNKESAILNTLLESTTSESFSRQVEEPTLQEVPPQKEEEATDIVSPQSIISTSIIQPDPILNDGSDIKGPNQLIKLAEEKFNKIVRRGRFSKKSLGNYLPLSGAVRFKFRGDVNTAIHELAHFEDDVLRLGDLTNLQNTSVPQYAMMEKELLQLAPGGSGGPKKSLQYNLAEGVAEYIRSWIMNPKVTEEQFPTFTKYFKSRTPQATQTDFQELGNEIRKYYGAPALKQIASNVRFDLSGLKFLERTSNAATSSTGYVFKKTGLDKLKKLSLTDRVFLWKAIETAKGFSEKPSRPREDPELLYTLRIGELGRVATILESGLADVSGKQILPPFKEIYSDLDSSSYENLNNEMELAVSAMIAERAVEKEAIRGIQAKTGKGSLRQQGPLTGIAGTSNIASKGRTEIDVASQALQEVESLPEDQKKRVMDAASRFRNYADKVLRYLVDSGILSEESYSNIKSQNEYYVTMQRIMEDEDSSIIGGSKVGIGKPIRTFKGSGREVINPFVGLMEATARAVRAADRNKANRAFVDLLNPRKTSGMYGKPDAENLLEEIGYQVPIEEKDTLLVWRNGKKEYWKLDPDIKKAIDGFNQLPDSFLMNVVSAPAKLLKWGVNNSPSFATRNYIRDFGDRLVLSDANTTTQAKNFLRGTKEVISEMVGTPEKILLGKNNYKANIDKKNLILRGGDQGGHYARSRIDYHRMMRTSMRELAKDKNTILLIPGRLWGNYEKIIQESEISGRLAEYRSQYEKAKKELGYDDEDASIYASAKAIQIMNFAEAGEVMRTISKIVPYTNAAIQGLRKAVNTATSDPKRFFTRNMVMGAIPILLMRAFNEDRDADDEYEQLPWYRRDLFFNFKIGDDFWLTIPKPFSAMISSALIDRAYSASKGTKIDNDSLAEFLVSQAFPFGTEALLPVMKPTAEVVLNKDVFRKKTIVPPYEEYLPLDKRKEPKGASALGIAVQDLAEKAGLSNNEIAKTFLNARAFDHQIRGYFGNIGGLVLQASNSIKDGRGKPLTYSSLIGLGTGGTVYGSKDMEYIYKFMRENSVPSNVKSLRNLRTLTDSYFNATTPKQKEEKLEQIYKETARIRAGIEKSGRLFLVPGGRNRKSNRKPIQ